MGLVLVPAAEKLGEIQLLLANELFPFFQKQLFNWLVEFTEDQHIVFNEPKSYSNTRMAIRFEPIAAIVVVDRVVLRKRPGISEFYYDYADPAFPDNIKRDIVSILEDAEAWLFNSHP